MSSGLQTKRDFVLGLVGQGTDWHGKTIEKPTLAVSDFPTFRPEFLSFPASDGTMVRSDFQVLLTEDDGLPVGKPFNPDSFGYILPSRAWSTIEEALGGTRYSIERIGMLWD
jgi:hypothetical protein